MLNVLYTLMLAFNDQKSSTINLNIEYLKNPYTLYFWFKMIKSITKSKSYTINIMKKFNL